MAHIATWMSISNIDPLRYSDTDHSDANVVARAVRGYWVEVLDDAGDRLIHLHLIAGPQAHRQQFWFQDVYIDQSTDLPIRVNWAGDDSTMTADYETVQGSWLLISAARKKSCAHRFPHVRISIYSVHLRTTACSNIV